MIYLSAAIDPGSTYSVLFKLDDGTNLCWGGFDLRLIGARATWVRE